MIIIVLLIAVSLVIALVFLGIFFWNVRTGQYDDSHTPSIRILFDNRDDKSAESASDRKVKYLQ
jgi:cbb3-type cytochrome oxidase maturation protein